LYTCDKEANCFYLFRRLI